MLDKCGDCLTTDNLQYGFKRKSSTSDCTFALMKTVNYFKRNGTNPSVHMLDASKALNRVNYVELFRLLVKRDICPFVLRCLLHMYTNQNMNVHCCVEQHYV